MWNLRSSFRFKPRQPQNSRMNGKMGSLRQRTIMCMAHERNPFGTHLRSPYAQLDPHGLPNLHQPGQTGRRKWMVKSRQPNLISTGFRAHALKVSPLPKKTRLSAAPTLVMLESTKRGHKGNTGLRTGRVRRPRALRAANSAQARSHQKVRPKLRRCGLTFTRLVLRQAPKSVFRRLI